MTLWDIFQECNGISVSPISAAVTEESGFNATATLSPE